MTQNSRLVCSRMSCGSRGLHLPASLGACSGLVILTYLSHVTYTLAYPGGIGSRSDILPPPGASWRDRMNRYQLAKIVEWAGTLHSRKRMQKVVYLLQVAGCPLESDYILHHYGPYSPDVARLTDEMARVNLLEELSESNPKGQQYSYRLGEGAKDRITAFERTSEGRSWSEAHGCFREEGPPSTPGRPEGTGDRLNDRIFPPAGPRLAPRCREGV